jgi:hypothetical protein
MVTFYGPVDHGLSKETWMNWEWCVTNLFPLFLGDFNLISEEDDKNSKNVNYHLTDIFMIPLVYISLGS